MTRMIGRRTSMAMAGAAIALPVMGRADTALPDKPLKILVGFPAGGGTDVTARLVAQKMSVSMGMNVIVENKAGSGGNVGTDAIAKSAPDGYTIGLYTVASQAIAPTLYGKLPFDVNKDFTAVAMLWSVPNMLMVRLELPVKTIPDLIDLARKNPGKYTFASSGSGTTPHLTGERLLKLMARLDIEHVPYSSAMPAVLGNSTHSTAST